MLSASNSFYYVTLDAQTATNAMANGRLASFVQDVLGRPLQAGDYAVFAGTHLTTKEIDDWVWATFWWHDRPDAGSFGADRPATVRGVWRNYLMNASFDLNLPREPDKECFYYLQSMAGSALSAGHRQQLHELP